MKKTIVSTLFLSAVAICSFAQINVDNITGHVSIGNCQPLTYAILNMGSQDYDTYYNHGFKHELPAQTSKFNVGIMSHITASYGISTGGGTIGVRGIGGGYTNGRNFGVVGGLSGEYNGSGIFGTVSNWSGFQISGKYAGYFDGNVYCNNTISSYGYVTLSDKRLKQDISSLSTSTTEGSTLNNVLGMNVVTYRYKDREIPAAERDTISAEEAMKRFSTPKNLHYGLLAQELQEIYPDLVYEGQDGYLGVNYVELVPVLIRSIQELKQELDDVKNDLNGMSRMDTNDANGVLQAMQDRNSADSESYTLLGHTVTTTSHLGLRIRDGKKHVGK